MNQYAGEFRNLKLQERCTSKTFHLFLLFFHSDHVVAGRVTACSLVPRPNFRARKIWPGDATRRSCDTHLIIDTI